MALQFVFRVAEGLLRLRLRLLRLRLRRQVSSAVTAATCQGNMLRVLLFLLLCRHHCVGMAVNAARIQLGIFFVNNEVYEGTTHLPTMSSHRFRCSWWKVGGKTLMGSPVLVRFGSFQTNDAKQRESKRSPTTFHRK